MTLQELKSENGCYWKKYFYIGDKKTSIRLGRLSKKNAAKISGQIELLVEAKKHNQDIPAETKEWLLQTDNKLVQKLAKYGLCSVNSDPSLVEFAESYEKSTNIKPQSKYRITRTIAHLKDYFGSDKKLRLVTKADALAFYNWMIESSGLNQNTINRRASTAREIFAFAIESDLIAKNPFKQKLIKTSVGAAMKVEITKKVILDVIDHCPTNEWKLLFAFARFVGCRIPSEIQNLTWSDIDRERNQIRLWDEKREKNKTVPLFAEVEELIAIQYDEVADGEVYVFPSLRLNKNPGTTAKKYVKKAGYEVWNSFFNTLRANRETELMDEFGIRKACAWIGNTPETAMKNYSIVRGSDFDDSDRAAEVSNPKRVLKRVPNPPEQEGTGETPEGAESKKCEKSIKKGPLVVDPVIPLGLEPRTT